MASLETEYRRFLQYLGTQNVSDDARRLANLIGANLESLADVGAVRRARSTRLVPLALSGIATTSADIVRKEQIRQNGLPASRLHQLEVGPFRGFMRSEVFDLSRDITLIYGANGSGKSSFCEAMETAMLGSISEAIAKRVDHLDYCSNVRVGTHVPPVLTTKGEDGQFHRLVPDQDQYRFCFIEKNRLDAFARIAARTPGDQRQLLSTLFGIDQFSDFVRGFNPTLDDSLQLVGVKATQLMQARAVLAASEQSLRSHPDRMEMLQAREAALAADISPGKTYDEMVTWLVGTKTAQGQLEMVRAQLDSPSPIVRGFTVARVKELLAAREHAKQMWGDVSSKLAARAVDVPYAQLYEAVLALREPGDSCPACGTNLLQVQSNPFDRARDGLRELKELAELQKQELSSRKILDAAALALWTEVSSVSAALQAACFAEFEAAKLPIFPATYMDVWSAEWNANESSAWSRLFELIVCIEQQDTQAHQVLAQRAQLIQERKRLDEQRLWVERHLQNVDIVQQNYERAKAAIKQFDESNQDLITEVEDEKELTALNVRVKAAYDEYLPVLQRYLAALPTQLVQGLANQAKDLYNAFNRDDHATDKLVALTLPIAENGKIEIEFAGEASTATRPAVMHDALVVLSEGHIRCLGLAILVAKNIEQRCGNVIFDDVVNAIDDEHRNGIWRTFFEDDWLNGKQIILASHAEEFLLRIQQELGAARAGEIKRYKFLSHTGDHELQVDADPPQKNYVLLARNALDANEKRDALAHARRAIESLTDQLWTWMGKHGGGPLELKLSSPRSPWELNNKCSKLQSALRRMNVPNVDSAVSVLQKLLGVNGSSIEWRYLNSGTHDSQRDHDFDRATVCTLVEGVVELDRTITALRTP